MRLGIKAQITLFMLIGVVLTAAAFLVLHVAQLQTKAQLENKADEMTQQLLKTTALEEYVTLCLKETGGKGLNLLGMQGGVIYEDQNGSTPEIYRQLPPGAFYVPWNIDRYDMYGNKVATEEYYVSYNLMKPELRTGTNNPPVPYYPYLGNILQQSKIEESKMHYARKPVFKTLCDPTGPNTVQTALIMGKETVIIRPCESYGPPKSMQEELRDYVVKGLKECVDFQSFADIMGYNMTEGEIKANVTFGETNIIFDVDYPITFNLNEKRVFKTLKFRAELPVRIKRVHEYINSLLVKEGSDLFFNISRDYENITIGQRSYWLPGFSFTIFKDACPTCKSIFGGEYDDIIVVQDDYSKIKGEPFRFYSVIENRNPVLEQILVPNPMPDRFDIIVAENMTINISPIGYDPDDDELIYTYHGWKADYDEIYRTMPDGKLESEIKSKPINDWEQSQQYLDTLREAVIGTGRDDIGEHNVTVNVSDPEGLYDYQAVRIFVNDIPLADLQVDNMFSDIDDRYASIEDPIKLDASGTADIYTSGTNYIFEDLTEKIKLTTSDSVVFIPDREPENIWAMDGAPLSERGEHKMRLTVSDNMYQATGIGIAEKTITVFECVPHRNPGTAPVPYNNIPGDRYKDEPDPYQADHTCCTGDPAGPISRWGYAGIDKVCYKGTTFEVHCSKDRGNICNGVCFGIGCP